MQWPRLLKREEGVDAEQIHYAWIGDYVLLHNGQEEFWAEIVDKQARGYFDVIVSSKILPWRQISYGDLIRVHERHMHGLCYRDLYNE